MKKLEYLTSNKELFTQNAMRPMNFNLIHGLESSLYSLRIAPDIRIILTYDEDPLFNKLILTLIRIARRKDLHKIYKSVGESLYQDYLYNDEGEKYEPN